MRHFVNHSCFKIGTLATLNIGLILLLSSFMPPVQPSSVHKRAKTQPRPALSGPVLIQATENFVVHYTFEGEDAVSPADDDGNGLPDYVEAVIEALAYSWQQEVDTLGWRAPLPDIGEGGDTRFDVYLENQSEVFGYADTRSSPGHHSTGAVIKEDNPNPGHRAYAYLSLDNDYRGELFDVGLSPLEAMRTTVAHELHHTIQAAYDDLDPYEWLYEASAVWIEDELYPEIGDAKSYLVDYLDAPDLCPLSVGRDDQDVRWYGGWILLRYISEHYGGPATIQRLWEQMESLEGLAALEATLAEQGVTVAELLVDFSIANLTKSDCPTNAPYCYAHGSDYFQPHVESSVRVKAAQATTLIPQDGVQQFGADYVRLKSNEPIQIHFRGSTAGRWALRLVGLNGDQARVMPVAAEGPTTANPSEFERLYLLIVNTAPVELEEACGYHNYTLALATVASGQAIKAPPVPADPGPYTPPTYAGDDESGALATPGNGQSITAEEAPFPPLYPNYLRPDYALTDLVSYTAADLGDYAADYAPGGEPIIELVYDGPDAEQYLTITESATPYPSIETWVEDQHYFENDVRLVNNVPVHLVHYPDEPTPLSSATFIHNGLFIVIDGTVEPIDMQDIVASFVAANP